MTIRSSTMANRARRVLDEVDWCAYCGRLGAGLGPDGRKWHIDHVVPLALGGSDEPGNMVKACSTCNLKKNTELWDPLEGAPTAAGTRWWANGSTNWHIQQLRLKVVQLQDEIVRLESENDDLSRKHVALFQRMYSATEDMLKIYHATIDALMECA